MTPSGIEPATFRFVPQHLNHCATAVPFYEVRIECFINSLYLFGVKIDASRLRWLFAGLSPRRSCFIPGERFVADIWHWDKFFARLFCLHLSIIPRERLTHLYLCAFQTGGQGRSLGTLKRRCFFRNLNPLDRNCHTQLFRQFHCHLTGYNVDGP